MNDISNYDAIRILRTRTMDEISKINRQIQIIDTCISEAQDTQAEAEYKYEDAMEMAREANEEVLRTANLMEELDRQRGELADLVADLSITNKHLYELDEKLTFPNSKLTEEEAKVVAEDRFYGDEG